MNKKNDSPEDWIRDRWDWISRGGLAELVSSATALVEHCSPAPLVDPLAVVDRCRLAIQDAESEILGLPVPTPDSQRRCRHDLIGCRTCADDSLRDRPVTDREISDLIGSALEDCAACDPERIEVAADLPLSALCVDCQRNDTRGPGE